MDQNLESKLTFKDKFFNFYNLNKLKIFIFIFILTLIIIFKIFLMYNNERKNTIISEKYIQAGIYLASKKNEQAKFLYDEIILSKNNFYSILSLNTIIEKKLITDRKKILNYFEILEKISPSKENKDLIIFKKALYLIKASDEKKGNNLLRALVEDNSTLKPIAQELLKK